MHIRNFEDDLVPDQIGGAVHKRGRNVKSVCDALGKTEISGQEDASGPGLLKTK
jgi:hypothetical protein